MGSSRTSDWCANFEWAPAQTLEARAAYRVMAVAPPGGRAYSWRVSPGEGDFMVTEAIRAERIIRSEYPDVDIPEVSITELVLSQAAQRGDKPAFIDGATGRTITYAQIAASVPRVAAGLAAHGLNKGDVL